MDVTDLSGFHELVEQFSGEMNLAAICRLEGVDYRRSISWRTRNCYTQPRRKRALRGIMETVVTDMPVTAAPGSAGRAKRADRVGCQALRKVRLKMTHLLAVCYPTHIKIKPSENLPILRRLFFRRVR